MSKAQPPRAGTATTDGLSRPDSAVGITQRQVLSILLAHQRNDELPTNLRFVFYEGEQLGHWGKETRYCADGSKMTRTIGQDISRAAMVLREQGLVPWWWIEDETRTFTSWAYAECVEDYLSDQLAHLRLNPWNGEPPMILAESRSLAGVLGRIASRYVCPISAVGGQSSAGLITCQIAPYLREHPGTEVVYLGDLDLGGGQIEASLRDRLDRHAGREITWERVAILPDQVPALVAQGKSPIDKIDKRYRPPQRYEAWETEALGQSAVQRILTDHLAERCPLSPDDVHTVERRAIDHWRDLIDDPASAFDPDTDPNPEVSS